MSPQTTDAEAPATKGDILRLETMLARLTPAASAPLPRADDVIKGDTAAARHLGYKDRKAFNACMVREGIRPAIEGRTHCWPRRELDAYKERRAGLASISAHAGAEVWGKSRAERRKNGKARK